ncbi:NERD domain-containing protein [Candidatus Dojkabacteria bacterium]|nr:NERD domain-containing protein [Candidatus Dojkabacteria bacterium]
MKNYLTKRRNKWRTRSFIALIFSTILLLTTTLLYSLHWSAILLLTLAFFGFLFAVWSESIQKNYEKGIAGELLVENMLHEAKIIHFRGITLPHEYGDIDFVIVMPCGIFTLEVKAWEGEVHASNNIWYRYLNGKKLPLKSFSNQAKKGAVRLHKFIEDQLPNDHIPFFTPIVVLTEPFKQKNIHTDIVVTSPERLLTFLSKQSGSIDNSIKDSILEVLQKLTKDQDS